MCQEGKRSVSERMVGATRNTVGAYHMHNKRVNSSYVRDYSNAGDINAPIARHLSRLDLITSLTFSFTCETNLGKISL